MLLTDLRRQKRLLGKISGFKSRVDEPQRWLVIFFLALPALTNATKIKHDKENKDTATDLKANDETKDINLSNNSIKSYFFSNVNKPTKNESYSYGKDHSQTNKETKSILNSTYMVISGTHTTTKDNNTHEIGNRDAFIINDTQKFQNKKKIKHADKSELFNNAKVHNNLHTTPLNVTHENSDQENTRNNGESRHFKGQIAIDSKLDHLLNANQEFNNDNISDGKVERKANNFNEKSGNKVNNIKVEAREIMNAIEFGIKALEELVRVKEPHLYNLGLFLDKDHPAAKVATFGAPLSQKAILMARVGYATLEASKKMAEAYPENVGRQSAGLPNELQSRIDLDECPLRGRPRCPSASRRFRTSDGTCNNLEHPWRGSAMLPMQRFLPPVYEDGIQSVRRSVFGGPLPSARHVSTVIHRDKNKEIQSVTMMFTQWGQFIDHDITSTVKARSFNGSIPRCCETGGRSMLPPDLLHPSCLPIAVPHNDPFLSQFGIGCMEFIRSAPSTRIDCELGWREQINQVTPYIDASTIYGSDVDTSDSIRTFRNGQIIYGRAQNQGPLNPPDPPEGELCRAGALTEECLQPGDARASETPGLIAMHTIFVRYHNKVATVLSQINTHWSDERVYQETRRIVYSVIQHITYREYLPVVLGPEVMDIFELRVLIKGFYDKYDKRIIPAVANSFGTAAFRFGHSMVPNSLIRTDSHHNPLPNNVSLHEEISNFNHMWTFGSMDRILLGLSNQQSRRRDEFIAEELTNHLFQFSTPFGMDLAAINIQRGRDHGIPPYTFWRKPCGLSTIVTWEDLEKVMSINLVKRLQTLYQHVDDVDLFTGGLAERPLRGGVVGPTFACIIAQQFSNIRRGDRFWFENKGFDSSLSPAQLQQIRRVSLAQIICQTTDEVETIQPFVFLSADKARNMRVSCDSPKIRNFDLGAWTEESFESNSISNSLNSLEETRSRNDNKDLIRRRRITNRHNLRTRTQINKSITQMKPKHNILRKQDDPFKSIKETPNTSNNVKLHRRKTRSTKKESVPTTTKRSKVDTHKSKTKTNSAIITKANKIKPTTLKPFHITSIPMEVRHGIFNDVPKKPTFAGFTSTGPTKKKPQYYQILDKNHDDVTFLIGIVPEQTTKGFQYIEPLQVNININYSPHSTATTTPLPFTKKKKLPHASTGSSELTNGYTSKPFLTGTHKPTYGQSDVVLITKRPPTFTKRTKRPLTAHSTAASYPIFVYNSAFEEAHNYIITTKKPTYLANNDFVTTKTKRPNMSGYNNPTDIFQRPINVNPNTGYYAESYNDDRYAFVHTKPSLHQTEHSYDTGFNEKPLYISTSEYGGGHYLNRPSTFEDKPFSTSNNPVSGDFGDYNIDRDPNNRPTDSYYYDNDNDSNVVVITPNKRRPQINAYNRDETVFNDDILEGFFNRQDDSTNRKPSGINNSNTKRKVNVNIDGKLDFKSRVVYKKTGADKDTFVQISSVRKEEIFKKEDDVNKKRIKDFRGKLRQIRRRSLNRIRVVDIDVTPSETRNQWKYFNTTKEPNFFEEVPELPVNMPCSYEVPRPMTFLPSSADRF